MQYISIHCITLPANNFLLHLHVHVCFWKILYALHTLIVFSSKLLNITPATIQLSLSLAHALALRTPVLKFSKFSWIFWNFTPKNLKSAEAFGKITIYFSCNSWKIDKFSWILANNFWQMPRITRSITPSYFHYTK